MVEAAKAEAERLVSSAQKEAQDLLARTRQEVRVEGQQLLEAAIKTAEEEKRKRLAKFAAELEAQLVLDQNSRQQAVAEVIRCVCGLGKRGMQCPA